LSSTERTMVPPTEGSTGVLLKSSFTASTTLAAPPTLKVTVAVLHSVAFGAGRQTW